MAKYSGPGWSITSINEGVLLKLEKSTPEIDRQLGFAMRDVANDIPAEVVKEMSDYSPGQKSASSAIMVRTGKLAQSVKGYKKGSTLESLEALITAGSSTVPYARVQEYGTVGAGGSLPDIKPKRARYLRVPLPHILTDRGDVKGDYQIVERGGRYSTAGGKPTWISGRAIMIEDGGKPVPIWALITEAKIPPRLGIGKTIAKRGKWIRDRLLKAVDKGVRK